MKLNLLFSTHRVPLQEGLDAFTLPEKLSVPLAVEDSLIDKTTDVNALDPSPLTQSRDGKTEGENNTGNDDKSVMNEVSFSILYLNPH